jgi:hypothetical protein
MSSVKKLYISIFYIGCSFFLKAQYTLTSASNPVPGDIQSFVDLDSTGLLTPGSGISQTWNYSTVTALPYPPITSTFVAMSSVPNNFMFSAATIGIDLGAGSYGVLSNTSTKFEYLGYAEATVSNCWSYSDPFKPYSLPFTYGSTSADTYLLIQSTNTTVGTFTTYGDGTGTLQLPTATIPNVLKLHYTQYESDTTSSGSIQTFTVSMDQLYASVSKFPLLEIQTSTMTITTGTTITTTYNKNGRIYSFYYPLGINGKEKMAEFSIFPNPVTNGEVFVSNIPSSEKMTAEIYTILGQTVKTVSFEGGSESKKINVSDLAKGIYYLKVNSKEAIKTQKIIIE